MTSKHTPGPWVADIKADGSTEVWSADYSMFIAKRHQMNDRDEAKANTNLIAAAPDLLAALEKIVFDEERRRKDLRHNSPAAKFCDARLDAARAAIAKARGE